MCCLRAKPTDLVAITSVLANKLFHVLGKDYFMIRKIFCGFLKVHSPFNSLPHI